MLLERDLVLESGCRLRIHDLRLFEKKSPTLRSRHRLQREALLNFNKL